MHALIGITYGAFLAYLVPELIIWLQRQSGFTHNDYGWLSWILSTMALGVMISSVRDLTAIWRKRAAGNLLGLIASNKSPAFLSLTNELPYSALSPVLYHPIVASYVRLRGLIQPVCVHRTARLVLSPHRHYGDLSGT